MCGICCRCHHCWLDLEAASHPVWQKLKAAQAEYRHAMADLAQQDAPSTLFLSGVSSMLNNVAEVCPGVGPMPSVVILVPGLVNEK